MSRCRPRFCASREAFGEQVLLYLRCQPALCAVQIVPELVERNFGEYELQSDSNYQKVWNADADSLDSAPNGGGESVTQVGPA